MVDIPFAFVVTDHTLPPGRYTVTHVGEHALRIHGSNNQATVVLTNRTEREGGDTSRKMVFHRYGTVYFLSEVWETAAAIGRSVPKSRGEEKFTETGVGPQIAALRIP